MSENQRIAQLEAEIERLEKRIEELLDANGYMALALAKAEDEIGRLRKAGYGGLHYDLAEKQRQEIERLRHELEGKISQSYAAELARQVGELEAENELLREVIAVGGEPGASAGKSE
jgi:predicted RNase H-like nuclease (RuvC/YqgF family)